MQEFYDAIHDASIVKKKLLQKALIYCYNGHKADAQKYDYQEVPYQHFDIGKINFC